MNNIRKNINATFQKSQKHHRRLTPYVSFLIILILLNHKLDHKDLINYFESVYIVNMNRQNEPLLTIHDLLAREEPSLRRASLPITRRVITYVAAVHALMTRLYLDEPLNLWIDSSGMYEGAVKPCFWRTLATIALIQQIIMHIFWLFACKFYIHFMVYIPTLFMPISSTQGYVGSYLLSWIITFSLLLASVNAKFQEWRILVGQVEEEIAMYANQN
ncbi:hypothetical protein EAE96_010437 [Botrytis aclada]|nr:hypothetical protein EAE96_010437 [Botrytis aclada]